MFGSDKKAFYSSRAICCFDILALLFQLFVAVYRPYQVDGAFLLALFFAWMITNIYLLLLYTFSTRIPAGLERPSSIISPNLLKYGFIIFIAILTSKPLELVVYSDIVKSELGIYKHELKEKYTQLINECFKQETTEIIRIIESEKNLHPDSPELQTQLDKYLGIVKIKEQEKMQSISKMSDLISKSGFYIQGIIILSSKYLNSWLFTMIVIITFLCPVLLKHLASNENEYYQIKGDIETRLITESTEDFLKRYNESMHARFGEKYSWQDFNEEPQPIKEEKIVHTEKDLIDSLYHA
ncbi:MAG: hypothetical protein IPM36_17150 [Lewinellaceae bacterium]|nr:hypothetical protein [Lewinellaceae bacterium]